MAGLGGRPAEGYDPYWRAVNHGRVECLEVAEGPRFRRVDHNRRAESSRRRELMRLLDQERRFQCPDPVVVTMVKRASVLDRIVDDVAVDERLPGIQPVHVSDRHDGQSHDRRDCADGDADSERSVP